MLNFCLHYKNDDHMMCKSVSFVQNKLYQKLN